MSNRVTNAEVEDVLSSIRRLVSDDDRSGQEADAEKAAAAPAAFTERLVLTPALRVTEDTPPTRVSTDATSVDDFELDSSISVTGDEGSDVGAAAFAADYSTDPYQFDDDANDGGDSQAVSQDKSTSAADKSQDANAPDTSPDTPKAKIVSGPAARGAKIAALETAIGEITDVWEPDHAGESDYAGTEAQRMDWKDEEAESNPSFRPILPPVSLKSTDDEAPDEAKAAEAKPADPVPTPGAFTSTRTRSRILAEEEQAKAAEAARKLEASTSQAEEVSAEAGTDDVHEEIIEEEQFIDEALLREMVSEIVRTELRGALGERITRNVRKLVRREIHRALAAQDLE